MKSSSSRTVRIVENNDQASLSTAQKMFNKLIKKIDKERKLLEIWQTTIPLYQQKYANEFNPQVQTFNTLRAELVRVFDQAYINKGFSKNDKAKLRDIICTIAVELIMENDNDDLKQIYNKHSGSDFDAESEEEETSIKAFMESVLGIELGDEFDLRSPEKTMAHFDEKMREKIALHEQLEQARLEQQGKRKKSAKVLAKEAKQQEETQNISQSIREVYRKLASALHPDREPDMIERERKNALMQRVNVAYDAKDLLQLLELQLEIEQIDQLTINTLTEERLKYYNKILMEQSAELRQEVSAIRFAFNMRFDIPPDVSSPVAVMHDLESDIKQIKRDIESLKNDLPLFKDSKNIKRYLKSYQISSQPFVEEGAFEYMGVGPFFNAR